MRADSLPAALRRNPLLVQCPCCVSRPQPFDPQPSRRAAVLPLAAPAASPKQTLRSSRLRPCRLHHRAALSDPAAPRACAGPGRHQLRRPRTPSSSTRAAPRHASVHAVSRPAALRRNQLLVAVLVLRRARPQPFFPQPSDRAAVLPLAEPADSPKQTLRRLRLRPSCLCRHATLSGSVVLHAYAGPSRHSLRLPCAPFSSARAAPPQANVSAVSCPTALCRSSVLSAPVGSPKQALRRSRPLP